MCQCGVWMALACVAPLGGGCARPPTRDAAAVSVSTAGPRETLQALMKMRADRQYRALVAQVAPPHGADVVELLLAVDDFLGTNEQLCHWLREYVGLGVAQTVDQAYVADDLALYVGDGLGVFSRRVELLDDAVDGDVAEVAYVPEGRLPARRARLVRVDGTWRLDPGPGYSAQLPTAFRDMAQGLGLVLRELESGRPSADEIRSNPLVLMEKVKARLRRGVGLLSKARAANSAPGAESSGP